MHVVHRISNGGQVCALISDMLCMNVGGEIDSDVPTVMESPTQQ